MCVEMYFSSVKIVLVHWISAFYHNYEKYKFPTHYNIRRASRAQRVQEYKDVQYKIV